MSDMVIDWSKKEYPWNIIGPELKAECEAIVNGKVHHTDTVNKCKHNQSESNNKCRKDINGRTSLVKSRHKHNHS